MDVYSPPGTLIGVVEEVRSSDVAEFDIKDENGDVVLKIEGPLDLSLRDRRVSELDLRVLILSIYTFFTPMIPFIDRPMFFRF